MKTIYSTFCPFFKQLYIYTVCRKAPAFIHKLDSWQYMIVCTHSTFHT